MCAFPGPQLLSMCRANSGSVKPAHALEAQKGHRAAVPSPSHLLHVKFDDTQQIVQLSTYAFVLEHRLPNIFNGLETPPNGAAIQLNLPSTASFSALHYYWYLQDSAQLFDTLFRGPKARRDRSTPALGPGVDRQFVLDQAGVLYSLWRNMIALRIQDDPLWHGLDQEWSRIKREIS